jgi:hypothetical protein
MVKAKTKVKAKVKPKVKSKAVVKVKTKPVTEVFVLTLDQGLQRIGMHLETITEQLCKLIKDPVLADTEAEQEDIDDTDADDGDEVEDEGESVL